MRQFTSEEFKWLFEKALQVRDKAECTYKQVGALLVRFADERFEIVATGYNHSITPFRRCTEEFILGKDGPAVNSFLHCNQTYVMNYAKGKLFNKRFLKLSYGQFIDKHRAFSEAFECHAELDAVFNLKPETFADIKGNLEDYFCVVTSEPCLNCCKYLCRLGVNTVYYLSPSLDYNLAYKVPVTMSVVAVDSNNWSIYKE